MAVLMVAGLQVPLMPLVEVVGRAGALEFWHNGSTGLKSGSVAGLMTNPSVTGWAHCPALGVKVVEKLPGTAVLMVAGFQVPLMPLLEVEGSDWGVEFWHITPTSENVGVVAGVMVIWIEVGFEH